MNKLIDVPHIVQHLNDKQYVFIRLDSSETIRCDDCCFNEDYCGLYTLDCSNGYYIKLENENESNP